jgi:hypothetical protein
VPKSEQINRKGSVVTIAASYSMARRAVERDQMRLGLTQEQAAATIARRIREAPGTVLRLVKGQAKRIDAAVKDKLTAYVCRQLETEIEGLSHELALYRAGIGNASADRLDEAEALLARARALMEAKP